jgi:dinuclear metal center YbgI/SA1388 family protein
MVTIKELIRTLEAIAPPRYQESYDNAGLITGSPDQEVTGVITCLDSTEAVVEEAIQKGCNLIVAHHPIIFRGLKKLTGRTYVERTVIKAIRHDIAIYAIHTNLDNVYHQGVNTRFAQRLGLERLEILAPKAVSQRMSGIIPIPGNENLEKELEALGANGIQLNGIEHDESALQRISFSLPGHQEGAARKLLKNARIKGLSVWQDQETTPAIGSGMIGFLPQAMEEAEFLQFLKERS